MKLPVRGWNYLTQNHTVLPWSCVISRWALTYWHSAPVITKYVYIFSCLHWKRDDNDRDGLRSLSRWWINGLSCLQKMSSGITSMYVTMKALLLEAQTF